MIPATRANFKGASLLGCIRVINNGTKTDEDVLDIVEHANSLSSDKDQRIDMTCSAKFKDICIDS